jgi:hypothetical protein
MRKLTKGLVAGAVGLAVLVSGGFAVADDSDTPQTPVHGGGAARALGDS